MPEPSRIVPTAPVTQRIPITTPDGQPPFPSRSHPHGSRIPPSTGLVATVVTHLLTLALKMRRKISKPARNEQKQRILTRSLNARRIPPVRPAMRHRPRISPWSGSELASQGDRLRAPRTCGSHAHTSPARCDASSETSPQDASHNLERGSYPTQNKELKFIENCAYTPAHCVTRCVTAHVVRTGLQLI